MSIKKIALPLRKQKRMYPLVKRLLFLFDPEAVHHFVLASLKLFSRIPFIPVLLRAFFTPKIKTKPIELFGLSFPHRVGLAAGFDKNAKYVDELSNLGFSFIEIGAVTPLAQAGNPKQRLFRIAQDKAIINRMGFNNKGLKNTIANLKKRKSKIIVGANIGKNTDTPNEKANDDYLLLFEELHDYVDYFTVNVSCPNVKNLQDLQKGDTLTALLTALQEINQQKNKPKPILLKISPDLTWEQLDDTLRTIEETKIDGIVAVNTTSTRNNLTISDKEITRISNGGLSGAPLKDRATEVIKYIHDKTHGKLPIIGVGGIMTKADAQEKIDAGASLLQVFTGFIYEGPRIVQKINRL